MSTPLRLLLLVFTLLAGRVGVVDAQWREGFESPDATFSLSGADGGVRVLSHRREFEGARSGSGVEHLRFVSGRGTYIHYSMPIERSPLIDETAVSLWVRGDRPQFQLLVRVVLPRTIDDRTGKPLTTLLRGDEYIQPGTWQQLRVADLPRLMARDLVVLRRQYGPQVDARESYIDMVVLNAFGGVGETNIWIDDLEVAGVIDPQWAKETVPAATSRPGGDPAARPATERPLVIDGELMLSGGRPRFIRAIEDRGESWEWFRSLGFNTVWLAASPTENQQEEAKRLGLWMIAPPPDVRNDPVALAKADNVIAWMMGRGLQLDDLHPLRSLAREIRSADRQLRRPLVASASADLWSFSRELDILLQESPTLFSSVEIDDFATQIQSRWKQARSGTPLWVTLSLDPAPALGEQLKGLAPESTLTPQADLVQARLALYAVLRTGTRGILFRSGTRLDAPDEIAAQRQAILRLLNHELELLEPWLAGGAAPQEVPVGDADLKTSLWQTERSRLLLISRTGPQSQYVTAPLTRNDLSLVLPGIPAADRVFHITADGLRPLSNPVSTAGTRLEIPEAGHTAAVVITQNSLVIQHLAQLGETQRRAAIETRLRLAANQLTTTELALARMQGLVPVPPPSRALLAESQQLLNQADVLLSRGDWTGCLRRTRGVEEGVARVRRLSWETARAGWTNSLAHPLLASFDTLPAQAEWLIANRERSWGPNAFPEGGFEQLDRLLGAGWKQQREESGEWITRVELSRTGPRSGQASLHLSAIAQGEAKSPAAGRPAVKIISGPLTVRAGQLVRLRGWARVPQGAGGELLIHDNLCGEELAERLRGANEWREFTLLRVIPADGVYQVHFALTHAGEAFIDDVSLEFSEPLTSLPPQPRQP